MDFHEAFYEIDADRSGEITRDELVDYMRKKNYKETFVQKWLSIFDVDQSGTITYEEYCNTLGLIPKDPEPVEETIGAKSAVKTRSAPKKVEEETISVQKAARVKSAPPKRPAQTEEKGSGRNCARNKPIHTKGIVIMRFSPARVIQKKALYRHKPATVRGGGSKKIPAKQPETVTKKVNGENNGDSRTVSVCRSPRFYPSETKSKKDKRPAHLYKDHLPRLRASIRPGTILIMVAGRHRGKRVVCLKQMERSGLLLVTGPFKLNGCPLRRVNQRHVIASSAHLDISQISLPDRLTDKYFQRARGKKSKEDGDIFKKETTEYELSQERKEDQNSVDSAILKAIASRDDAKLMKGYLRDMFSIKSGQYPHQMKF